MLIYKPLSQPVKYGLSGYRVGERVETGGARSWNLDSKQTFHIILLNAGL
jgi:hypothetical protein